MSAYNINANTDIKDDLEYLKPKEKHKIGIGGGFIYKPTYVGSSSIRTVWFPTVTYQYNDPGKSILTLLISLVLCFNICIRFKYIKFQFDESMILVGKVVMIIL